MNSEPLSESIPFSANGRRPRIRCSAANTQTCALLITAWVSVQPLARPLVNSPAPPLRRRRVAAQQPDRIPPVVASKRNQLVEQPPFLFLARPAIPRHHHRRYGSALVHRQPHLASSAVPEGAFRSDFLDEATNRFHSDF